MKIEYVRNIQSSYMRMTLAGELDKTEEEMLSRNQIEGILGLSWQKEDNSYLLRYDITGKQALDTILENQLADEDLLLKLVLGICQTCRRVERYLLSEEHILLCPETIYWDNKIEEMCFCYYPGDKESFQEQFAHLMEYMLTKTNHKNVQAVEIAYGVYEELMKPTYSLGEIQNRIEALRESWRKEKTYILEQEDVPAVAEEKVEVMDEQKKFWWKNLVKEKIEDVKKWMVSWIKPGEGKHIKRKVEVEPFVFEPVEEPEKQGLPTVLLSERKEEVEGVLKYEGRHALPDLNITKVPFLIGSAKNCDGVINDETVSRQHAKITKIEDVYFIEDLNSSNGTKVDGGLLSYKTRVSLKKNESVHFANQPYRFL